jgi:DNA repair protein RadC
MESSNKSSTTIKNWAIDDRPREKLLTKGRESLSNSELLAILISTGSGKKTAVDLAKEVLEKGKNNLDELGKLSLKDLTQINGIGSAKAITILAALELGRRRHASSILNKKQISSSKEIADFLQSTLKDYRHEVFAVVYLNKSNKINHFEIISTGGVSGTIADPRIIFSKALDVKATALILCHNHPSGNLKPSRQDEELTQKLRKGGEVMEIKVLDHIIVSDEGYYSFADNGMV